MNTIRKNSQGYGYKYSDLAEIHRYLEESGQRYYQIIETVDGNDYVITHVLDTTGKEIRKCRGCRIPLLPGGKNPAQEYGSALSYARRYSLLLAFGLATADDDGAAFNPARPKAVKPKATDKPVDRQAGVDAVKRLLDNGILQLSDIQTAVKRYGVEKMQDLPNDAFIECVATLTKSA